jgi:hypothetical protein
VSARRKEPARFVAIDIAVLHEHLSGVDQEGSAVVCIVVCDVHAVERQSLAIEINAPRSIASPTPVQLTVRHGHVRSGVIGVVTDGPRRCLNRSEYVEWHHHQSIQA